MGTRHHSRVRFGLFGGVHGLQIGTGKAQDASKGFMSEREYLLELIPRWGKKIWEVWCLFRRHDGGSGSRRFTPLLLLSLFRLSDTNDQG
jgi:hypothetical protein